MANKEANPPPADPIDGYRPQDMAPATPVSNKDPAVRQAAYDQAELEQRQRGARWDAKALDGFVNMLLGYGDPNQDKLLGGVAGPLQFVVQYLAGGQCEDRWRGSDLGGRVVEQVPAEMTRQGFELTVQPDDDEDLDAGGGAEAAAIERVDHRSSSRRRHRDAYTRRLERRIAHRDWPEQEPGAAAGEPKVPAPPAELPYVDEEGQAIVEEIDAQLRGLDALSKFREAAEYVRAYGGAGILLGADDGVTQNLMQPLREDQLAEVKHLTVFRGGWDGELVAWRYYNDPRKANYGMPEVYMVRNIGVPLASAPAPGEALENVKILTGQDPNPTGALVFFVHESRLLIFPGKAVSRRARVQMRGWGDTVFMRVDEVLTQYSQTWQAIANIMVEWSMGVLSMEGLAEMFSAQGDPMALPSGGVGQPPLTGMGLIAERIRAINLSKSNIHTVLLDSTEQWRRETSPLSGLAEVLQSFMLRLAAAVDMPVSLLMGQSPGGLRAGDDDVRFFYDRIMSKIQSDLLPLWRRLIRLLFISKRTSPTNGKEPRKWQVTARPLRQLNEKEAAEVRKTQADADAIYIDRGVQTPAETTSSRFGGSKWSGETTIDFEARAQASRRMALAAKPTAGAKPGSGGDGGGAGAATLTPSAAAAIMTVNEARERQGLGPWHDPAEGMLTVAEFQAKRAAITATVANAEQGKVGTPPAANEPKPAPIAPGAPHPSSFGAPNEGEKREVGSNPPPQPGEKTPDDPAKPPPPGKPGIKPPPGKP